MNRTTFYISDEEREYLKKLAFNLDISVNSIIRALINYLKEEENALTRRLFSSETR